MRRPGESRRVARDLNESDIKVLRLLVQGYSQREVEELLGYSPQYVHQKLGTVIYPKLGVVTLAQCVYIAMKRGIIK